MKRKVFFILFIVLFSEFVFPQIKVPEKVIATFNAMFPGAREIDWGKESDMEYEAEFEMNGRDISANFDSDGIWLVTETVLSADDLPEPVLKTIKSQFNGSDIVKVESVEKASEPIQYEVLLEKDENKREVMLDAVGGFLRQNIVNKEEDEEDED
jgi:uncharacterized membrane protein YkoI